MTMMMPRNLPNPQKYEMFLGVLKAQRLPMVVLKILIAKSLLGSKSSLLSNYAFSQEVLIPEQKVLTLLCKNLN